MGGNNSQIIDRRPTSRKHIDDHRYGGNVIFSQVTHTVYQMLVLQQKSLAAFSILLEQRKALIHPYFLTVKNSFTKPQENKSFTCQSDKKMQLYLEYPYLSKTLQDIIQEYSDRNQEIPEDQIIYIFVAVVEVLNFLKKNKTCHGDVKASNIVFDHTGAVKLIDSYFINGGKTAYQIVMENPSSMSLLSPQQLQRIKNRQLQDLSTIHTDEIFAVGLTMIEAMTFDPGMQFYDLNKLTIREQFKTKKIKQMKQGNYSQKLVNLASKTIATNACDRPTFDQFLLVLKER